MSFEIISESENEISKFFGSFYSIAVDSFRHKICSCTNIIPEHIKWIKRNYSETIQYIFIQKLSKKLISNG